LKEAAEKVVVWERSTNNLMELTRLLDELEKALKDSLTTQTVEKWEDFELYDVFETAIQESALTVVTKYHNLDEETTELALECVRIFKELKGTTYQNIPPHRKDPKGIRK
jgi:hypothetical protein